MTAARLPEPTAAIIDSRTLRSTPESEPCASYDGARRKRGAKLHMAVETLGYRLALYVMPANHDNRAEFEQLGEQLRDDRPECRACLCRSGP